MLSPGWLYHLKDPRWNGKNLLRNISRLGKQYLRFSEVAKPTESLPVTKTRINNAALTQSNVHGQHHGLVDLYQDHSSESTEMDILYIQCLVVREPNGPRPRSLGTPMSLCASPSLVLDRHALTTRVVRLDSDDILAFKFEPMRSTSNAFPITIKCVEHVFLSGPSGCCQLSGPTSY